MNTASPPLFRADAGKAPWSAMLRAGCCLGLLQQALCCGVLTGIVVAGLAGPARAESMDLAGPWSLQLGSADADEDAPPPALPLPHVVRLPGSIQEQGFGEPPAVDSPWTGSIMDRSWFTEDRYRPYRRPGQIKLPFWLTPQRVHVGPVWMARPVTIPETWAGRRITLYLERPHWTTTCYVDNRKVGFADSLVTAHVYDLTDWLTPGRHTLLLCVDNRMHINVGPNAHSVSDHTQGNWNGIVGRIELRAGPRLWVDHVEVRPDVDRRCAALRIELGNATGKPATGTLRIAAFSDGHRPEPLERRIRIDENGQVVALDYPLGEKAKLWDEYHPNLYHLEVMLTTGAGRDVAATSFGLRRIKTTDRRIVINGNPVLMRGTVECNIFPRTGYPPMHVREWKRIIGIAKACGMNHFRFHSWCPPRAAFVAADELGFYFQVEGPFWVNQGSTLGDGKPVDAFVYAETDRILRTYGNHPSFVMMAYGNEPAGRRHREFLSRYVNHYKARDDRRLWTAASGWPQLPENQYHVMPRPLRLYRRLEQQPLPTTFDYRQVVQEHDKPLIAHEPGQWCVFPNLDEIDKYTGNLRAGNFQIVRDFLEQKGLAGQAHDFLLASGKFQALLYKQEVESFRRTPDIGGYQLLQLHDFPGQGTALVGLLDAFFDPKGYITYQEICRFNGPVVPLVRMDKRVWLHDEKLQALVQVSNFGEKTMRQKVVAVTLSDGAGRVLTRDLRGIDLPAGSLATVGSVSFDLKRFTVPAQLKLRVAIQDTPYANDWDLWVYPPAVESQAPKGVVVATALTEAVLAHLKSGGRVLLAPGPGAIAGDTHGSFATIFWNKLWFPRQRCHTLGILCDPRHPALAEFPTDGHSNWQWWDLTIDPHARPMVMDPLPRGLFPIVQVIDDWNTCRKLGLVFEARVGGGKLLMTSIDLTGDLEHRPVARQFRRSLLDYMAGEAFNPKYTLTVEQVRGLMALPK